MAELNFPNITGAVQQGYAFGTQQRQNAVAERQSAVQFEQEQEKYGEERQAKTLVNMAKMLTTLPAQARPAMYQKMVPVLRNNIGLNVPDAYDDTSAQMIDQTAQSILQAYSGEQEDTTPADIRSLQILQGNPELLDLDLRRRQAGGMVPKLVETSQGYGWGTPGAGIQLAPLEGVAGQQSPQAAPAPALFAALGQKYGIQPTSVQRSTERNTDVGGVPNSYHLSGQAADWVVPQQYKAQFMQDARANGYEAIDEGDHIHIEPAGSRGGPAQGGGSIAQPRPPDRTPPAGYRTTTDGNLEVIPGGPADKPEQSKPMPASILKMRQEAREALSVSEGIDSELARIYDDLDEGRLELGLIRNQLYKAANVTGQSTDASRRYQGMTSTFEKLRNDSLRLNNGVQTEGDAQRAWKELLGNLNDTDNVKEQLRRIRRLNERAIMLHQENMEAIDQEYGRGQRAASGPQPGTVEGGYRFRGGDPSDQNNWEAI